MTTQTPHSYLVEYEKPCDRSARNAEHRAVAWLGQAGLYQTRFDAVRNFEQSVRPISTDELFELASKQVSSQLTEGRKDG